MNVKLRNLLVFMSKVAIYTYLAFFAFLTYANESEAQRKKLGEVKINLSTSSHTWALDELMDEIESKSVFQFAYRRGDVKRKQIYLDPSEWNLFDLLKEISSQGRFDIKRVNESIALTPVNTNTALPSISERIQTFEVSISGRVIDENGEPLIGVAILEKGTTNGTTTDISGNFQLDLISEDPSIIISYVGYAQQEINVGNQTTFDIQLELDIESLAEIVVVGYGSVKKSDLTGAVSSVKSEDLVERPVPTIDQALQGRVAGATIRTNSAAPGGGMNIVI
ncbi:MAG: carboxypeptidase-like regulatory domain-containing protein, partial [Bacteroidota bacterium]